MIKITMQYKDFDENTRTEDFWFHLSEAEIAEWHLTHEGEDLKDYLERIIATTDRKELIKIFKELLVRSIGRRTEDGRRFEKSDDITKDFMQTNAYSDLFMRLAVDAPYAADFFNGIVPKDLLKKVQQKVGDTETVALPEDTRPAWEKEDREPTQQELLGMSEAEMKRAWRARAERVAKN
jgi:hypothetical protein